MKSKFSNSKFIGRDKELGCVNISLRKILNFEIPHIILDFQLSLNKKIFD